MTRTIVVHGEAMLYVKGPQGSAIASLSELGLSETDLRIQIVTMQRDIRINAWGDAPADVQYRGAHAYCTAQLIEYDPVILQECVRLAMGGAQFGQITRAGPLIGGGRSRFDPGNFYIGLNIAAPQSGLPWRFFSAYIESPIGDFVHGTNPGVVTVKFRAVPYTPDAWQNGAGSQSWPLFDRTLDN